MGEQNILEGPNPESNPKGDRFHPPHHRRASVTSQNGMEFGKDLLLIASQSVTLGLDTLRPTLTLSLVLGTLSVHLLLEDTRTLALSLGLLDL